MPKPPPVDERQFLELTRNHGEFCAKLRTLGLTVASSDIADNAKHVTLCWLRLAVEHLEDAQVAQSLGRDRSAYSRAYYAVYNASKSVRYTHAGAVTLTGDDHKRAPDLPDDFPNVEHWAESITKLLEHRQRADYDNWASTRSELALSSEEVVKTAEEFLTEARGYLQAKYGIEL